MKVAILAGGFGSRLSEETEIRPKPMVEIGGMPILWHIMKHYAKFGCTDFVIALGYKGSYIKDYFADFCAADGDPKHTHDGVCEVHHSQALGWNIELVDTGLHTMTGGRIKRLEPYLSNGTFMLTWGDGVSDLDLEASLDFHRRHGKLATVTAVHPPARYGKLEIRGDQVVEFAEKPQLAEGWINGAFFVLEPGIFEYIAGDDTQWERDPMERLAKDGQLMAFRHEGFWQCMDTLREKHLLNRMWESGNAPWRIWQ